MAEFEPYLQEIRINYLKNVSNFRYEINGNGHISDLFRREDYQIDQKSERSYSLKSTDDPIDIPITGLGDISKIIVITPRFKSVKLHFIYDDIWEGKKEFIQYFTEFSIMSLDTNQSKHLSKLKLSTLETEPFRADINLYSIIPGIVNT